MSRMFTWSTRNSRVLAMGVQPLELLELLEPERRQRIGHEDQRMSARYAPRRLGSGIGTAGPDADPPLG